MEKNKAWSSDQSDHHAGRRGRRSGRLSGHVGSHSVAGLGFAGCKSRGRGRGAVSGRDQRELRGTSQLVLIALVAKVWFTKPAFRGTKQLTSTIFFRVQRSAGGEVIWRRQGKEGPCSFSGGERAKLPLERAPHPGATGGPRRSAAEKRTQETADREPNTDRNQTV